MKSYLVNLSVVAMFAVAYCDCQNVQIITLNSIYNHSFVNLENNFGDSNAGHGGANDVSQNDNSGGPVQQRKQEITPFSPYFGVEFVPYVKSASFPTGDYTQQDLKDMLNVILTKSHSILTMEMGFQDQDYTDGPWDITVTSVIATVAAQINSYNNTKLFTLSQGAGVLNKDGFQPDIEAAFYSAQYSNSIFPETVWGITLIPNYYDSQTEGYVQIGTSGDRVRSQLQKHYRRAHAMNLKLGAFIDQCEDIMGGPLKNLFLDLIQTSDHFVCSVYPKQPVSDPKDYFNVVVNIYETIKFSFKRHSPSLEVILQTGWASHGTSRNNPEHMNSPKKSKAFWDLMKQWAEERKVKVFMHEAFDIPRRSGNTTWGYWKFDQDNFIEKASGLIL